MPFIRGRLEVSGQGGGLLCTLLRFEVNTYRVADSILPVGLKRHTSAVVVSAALEDAALV